MNVRRSRASGWFWCLALGLWTALNPLLASDADAVAIERNIQARHLPFGTIVDPVFTSATSDQIVSYTRCGDSAIWTGHYLAAEAFHYKVTGSSESLANVKAALAGLKQLVDVTGTNLLARCAVPANSPYNAAISSEEAHNGIYQNKALGYSWVGNTSRDQYSGVFFGLGVAYDYVDDAIVRSSVQDLATRMLDYLIGHAWIVVMPDGLASTTFIIRPDQQLSFLQVGQHVNPSRFASAYNSNRLLLAASVLTPIALEVTSDSSYFKFNLDYINLYNLIRLENGIVGAVYLPAYSTLRNHTEGHQNPFFNMLDRALTGPNADRDSQTVSFLSQWLQRPRRDVAVDLRGKIPSCGDPNEACSPVPIPQRVPTDFLWQRDPFQLSGGGSGLIEGAGIDYLLPYWMARYYGLISGDTPVSSSAVVSAASGSVAIAPEEIVTLYGSNLATGTASAAAVPLPTTLGGVTIQVQDSAGATRLAPLFYVSPTQINFEIPAGSVAGRAKIMVNTAGGAPVASTDSTLQTVAPALFSADSTGKGVAAATALRVGVGGLQSLVAVFQCNAQAVCTAVPISLGADSPIYLTLYATGIRNRTSLSSVTVTVHGTSVPVQYAGPQGTFLGLDQVNVLLPLSLRGSGNSDVVVTVNGQVSNTVRINIQ